MKPEAGWKQVAFAPENGGALERLRVPDLSPLVAGNMTALQLAGNAGSACMLGS